MDAMNKTTSDLLKKISDLTNGLPKNTAYNIRQDSSCAGRQNTKNITITNKKDRDGIDIKINANTKGENVYIPACITKSGVNDLVYNDFFVGENADVIVYAGCGVHTDGESESQHNGIHRFFLEKNAKVLYIEKHIGEGTGRAKRLINPQTEIHLGENSYLEMDTTQIKGVDSTIRKTKGELKDGATLIVKEKIMTNLDQYAETDFNIIMSGKDSKVDLLSRSVARDNSKQLFRSCIVGDAICKGHSACDAIIMDNGQVSAIPELTAKNVDAQLIHEAAIGKIAGEQLIKLETLGLTAEEAEARIIDGFLK